MENVKHIKKILFLNKHKQEQVSIQISKINAAQVKKSTEIQNQEQGIKHLITKLSEYKRVEYNEKLKNTQLSILQINKIKHNMTKIKQELSDGYLKQEELYSEYQQLEQQKTETMLHKKMLLIKENKFGVLLQAR